MFAKQLSMTDPVVQHLVEVVGHEIFHVTQYRFIDNFTHLYNANPAPFERDADFMGARLRNYMLGH
jgi:hypothetical protein